VKISKLIEQTEATSSSSLFIANDIYDIMFSDFTRGDISLSELGSGEGSGDDNFTIFDTSFFASSTIDIGSTAVEESESPIGEITTESKTGTIEFGIDVTESDIIEETDVTLEGSGITSEEGSGTSTSTDEFAQETRASTSEFDSRFFSQIIYIYYIFRDNHYLK